MQLILGGLAGLMLAPTPMLATLPSSMQTLAGLVAAAPFSLLMGQLGRRAGFALGAALTLIGAMLAVLAMYWQSFAVLCSGHFLMGAGWAAFQYFRFAAAEVVDSHWQPVSISLMLTSGLVAAIVGPQLFIEAKDSLSPIPFAGAYAAVGVLSLLGLLPLAGLNMQLPKLAVRDKNASRFAAFAALRRPAIRRAVGLAAVAQGVMVFLMIPTPLAMVDCGFSDTAASDVIRWHIVAMFAPSFFTGFLIQRFGAQRIACTGLAIIVCAALAAAQGISAAHFYGALMVLGVGWNFAFIGATAMLAAAVNEEEKASIQGVNDTVIALASTLCAFAAGLVISALGWMMLAVTSACVVLLALVMLAFGQFFAVAEK